jgi:hypothetical protein
MCYIRCVSCIRCYVVLCVVCCVVVGCHSVVMVLTWCVGTRTVITLSAGLAFEPTKATEPTIATRIAIRSNQPKQVNRQLPRVLRSLFNAELAFEPTNNATEPTIATRIAIRSNQPKQLNLQLPRVLGSMFSAELALEPTKATEPTIATPTAITCAELAFEPTEATAPTIATRTAITL